ncbi:hypothetical protein GCM10010841_30170 [Deinococcus aerophilus]|uniref:histidine kinase n=1 Tax=Deinococcus aerophilus TaxID=522488 RepID=A0ABQ2GYL5_9DEIO|nr:hypothetical protein GCM10010841_30170 [Deinococcus aerophilus]
MPLAERAGVACAQLRRAFVSQGLILSLKVQRDVLVVADSDRVTQVLVTSNALRHTQHGGVAVRIDGSGRLGWLKVRDTGEGISTQDLPHAFERFYRSDQSRARDAEENIGAGVGLTVSHHLVVAMGATIQVSSTEGVGSTFTVRLPQGLTGELAGRSEQVG